MSTQDMTLLALTQVAVIVTGALITWTAWSAGYEAGWEARQQRDPIHRFVVAVQNMARQLSTVMPRIDKAVSEAGARAAAEAEEYANKGDA